MAIDKKVTGDLGSNLVEEMRLQLNRLTVFVEAIQAAALTDGDTFRTNTAALTNQLTDINVLLVRTLPPAKQQD